MPILIFSTADPGARAIALRLLEERVVKPIATWLNQANGAELAGRISLCAAAISSTTAFCRLPNSPVWNTIVYLYADPVEPARKG